jgi:hypothetical protein
VDYVKRESRPAAFADEEIQTERRRLTEKYGAPVREMPLRDRDGVATGTLVLWGKLQLRELDRERRSAIESGAPVRQEFLVDYLDDVRRSIRQGMPVYRLSGGPGYLWLAASNARGKGHVRFLAIDPGALTGAKSAGTSILTRDVGTTAGDKLRAATTPQAADEAAVASSKQRPTLASAADAAPNDLRPFLGHHPTAVAANDARFQTISEPGSKPQQSTVTRTRIEARVEAQRARMAAAERMAAEERSKAQVAWARVEAEKVAAEHGDRVRWAIIALLLILIAIAALLLIMSRERSVQTPSLPEGEGRSSEARSGGVLAAGRRSKSPPGRLAAKFTQAAQTWLRWRPPSPSGRDGIRI